MSRWTISILLTTVMLVSISPSTATPLPLPLALMMVDYSPSLISANRSSSDPFFAWRGLNLSPPLRHHQPRAAGSFHSLQKSYHEAQAHANTIKTLSAKSSSVDPDDSEYHNDFANALSGFNDNMDGFSTAFADSTSGGSGTSDKGLANLDNSNSLEVLLRNMVDLNKDVLTDTDVALTQIPVLGPLLGPLVYDLKCLIDKILDAVENCTDAIINQLDLGPLLSLALSTTCKSALSLLGICL